MDLSRVAESIIKIAKSTVHINIIVNRTYQHEESKMNGSNLQSGARTSRMVCSNCSPVPSPQIC